jgi:hypothetical protein
LNACGAVDPPRKEINVNLAINKKFEIKTNKKEMIKHFDTNPTFINLDEKSQDSVLYFDISIQDKPARIWYKTSLFQKNGDTLILILDSVINYRIYGKAFQGIDNDNIVFFNKLKAEDYVKFFDNAVISGLVNKNDRKKEDVVINFIY